MNVQIQEILDKTDINKERVVLKVLVDSDIGRYGILRAGTNKTGGITNRIYDAYWFPDKSVKAGDLVVFYSGSGIASDVLNPDGSTSHFFYWGKSGAMWTEDFGCVLVSIPEWQVYSE